MVTLSSPCRAQDSATCKYHGYEVRASQYVEQGQYDEAFRELAARERAQVPRDDVDTFIEQSVPSVDRVGVHTSHCCNIHGCKYGDKNCPVQTGQRAQEYPCEECDWDVESFENKYGKLKTVYADIKAVDPAGCGCTECMTGEHVPEIAWRLQAKSGDIKNVMWQKVRNNTGRTLTELVKENEFVSKSATNMQLVIKGEDPDDEEMDTWGL